MNSIQVYFSLVVAHDGDNRTHKSTKTSATSSGPAMKKFGKEMAWLGGKRPDQASHGTNSVQV
jgi:hypothetical protein